MTCRACLYVLLTQRVGVSISILHTLLDPLFREWRFDSSPTTTNELTEHGRKLRHRI